MRTPTWKTCEAFLRGYVLFRVNGVYYWTYASARTARLAISQGSLAFEGWHLFKGWVGFYYRIVS